MPSGGKRGLPKGNGETSRKLSLQATAVRALFSQGLHRQGRRGWEREMDRERKRKEKRVPAVKQGWLDFVERMGQRPRREKDRQKERAASSTEY